MNCREAEKEKPRVVAKGDSSRGKSPSEFLPLSAAASGHYVIWEDVTYIPQELMKNIKIESFTAGRSFNFKFNDLIEFAFIFHILSIF